MSRNFSVIWNTCPTTNGTTNKGRAHQRTWKVAQIGDCGLDVMAILYHVTNRHQDNRAKKSELQLHLRRS